MNKETMRKPIVEGIVAVANHKLRVEGVESYKKYLSQVYYLQDDIDFAIEHSAKKERKKIFENLSHAVCYGINGHVTEEELDKIEKHLKNFVKLQENAQ